MPTCIYMSCTLSLSLYYHRLGRVSWPESAPPRRQRRRRGTQTVTASGGQFPRESCTRTECFSGHSTAKSRMHTEGIAPPFAFKICLRASGDDSLAGESARHAIAAVLCVTVLFHECPRTDPAPTLRTSGTNTCPSRPALPQGRSSCPGWGARGAAPGPLGPVFPRRGADVDGHRRANFRWPRRKGIVYTRTRVTLLH